MHFSGRTVIITGAASGIGTVYAKAFAAEGANVVIADILEAEGEVVARQLNAQNGVQACFIRTDVTSDPDVARMAQLVSERFGSIDVLVNNAAIYLELGRKRPFDEITVDEWDRVMAVNVRGIWHSTKAVVPFMKQQGCGKIINISSVVAYVGTPGLLHYVASKAAVIGLTRALARELGSHNITVNAVAPGLVSNEASKALNPEQYFEQAAQARAIKRQMVPTDLVGMVLFLASPASDFISGQTFVVDGGAVMD